MLKYLLEKIKSIYKSFVIDWPLFLIIITITSFGLLLLISSSGFNSTLVYKQLIWLTLATIIMLIIAQIPHYYLKNNAIIITIFGILLLITVLLFGISFSGAKRWLNLGILSMQPSELMKIILPISISYIICEKTLPPNIITIMKSIFVIFIVTILIAIQPDLGTSILVALSGCYVLFFAGFKIKIVKNIWINILLLLSISSSILYIIWNYLLIPYQKNRILTLFNYNSDPLGSGYHILQSKIAIGSGGVSGKGLKQGSQSQLDFLPEEHTDFIFALLAEELGFIAILFLFFIYGLAIYRCLYISLNADDNFSKLLGASITMIFFTYIFVNIAMVSGLLPVVGIPLPLISYGGSSLVTIMIGFGIIMSINKHKIPKYLKK